MNLTALPTLEKIVLLKLASRVCNTKPYVTCPDDYTSRTICNNISSLGLPKLLEKRLQNLIKPVVMEICAWIMYIHHIHEQVKTTAKTNCSCLDEIDLQGNLRWKTIGLIDKYLVSRDLIRDQRLDNAFRFVLACNCCSETDILKLWLKLSPDTQTRFARLKFKFLPVVDYWTFRLRAAKNLDHGSIPNPPFPYSFEFDYSMTYLEAMYSYYGTLPYELRCYLFGTFGKNLGLLKRQILSDDMRDPNRVTVGLVNVDNIAALKYFLQRSERIKKQKFLEVVAENHFITNELLVYCLLQMTDAQIMALLRSGRRCRVLSCLMNSPWQEAFWDFVDLIWTELTASEHDELLTYINNFKIRTRWRDHDYVSDSEKLRNRFPFIGMSLSELTIEH